MASIHRKRGRYVVRWRSLDGRNRSRSCPTKESAKGLARDVEEALARGRDWTPQTPTRSLEELIAEGLEDRARGLTAGSVRNLEIAAGQFLDTLWKLHGKPLPPAVLTVASLRAYWRELEARVNPRTALQRIRMVEKLWECIYHQDDTGQIPAPRRLVDLPQAAYPHRPAPTWAEMDKAIAAAEGWYRDLFVVLRCTGLRRSQAMRLRWEWVSLEEGLLHIPSELGKSRNERRGRVVPLAPPLLAELKTWEQRGPFLIHTEHGGRRPVETTMRRIWERAGVRAEVYAQRDEDGKTSTCHAFRHGFVSGLVGLGASVDLVRQLVGHRGKTLEEVYLDPVLAVPALRPVVALIPPLNVGKQPAEVAPEETPR